ncbi:MAG: biotin carboxylase N-terminal domain-containing protein [Myxococcota bacterium]
MVSVDTSSPLSRTPELEPLGARIVRAALQRVTVGARAEAIPLVQPGAGYVSVKDALLVWLRIPDATLLDLGTLVQGTHGQRLMALRYILANQESWHARFAWKAPLQALPLDGDAHVARVEELFGTVKALRAELLSDVDAHAGLVSEFLGGNVVSCLTDGLDSPETMRFLLVMNEREELRTQVRAMVRARAGEMLRKDPVALDLLYLATVDLRTYPATTVSAGRLKYVIVADKGEMGVRAVREAVALGKIPVVCHSLQDDENALQVRLAHKHKGITVGLKGTFRETYANFVQIADRVIKTFQQRFGDHWRTELAQAAIYPGYGPLAENASAIRHFRNHGLVFVGPMQDVVENAGDKRTFRSIVQQLDPGAVTPGITLQSSNPAEILQRIEDAHRNGVFGFPGRLKAANGGGGRGQAIVPSVEALPAAITKVLGEIKTNGWDDGVMFEQNIPETVHLEVQVLRDRYGNTRHFSMRDCTEQRASQKIQEEAPPALLRDNPALQQRIQELAVGIADKVGYVGAGTIELMYKDGKVYFLEMNTRIQVEHPVTEEVHAIRRGDKLEPLNLVQWQMRIANGEPIDFAQDQLVRTHVGREFRINAESWKADLKDSRDGGLGLFLPNAGIFDVIKLPKPTAVRKALEKQGVRGIKDLKVRFDCGFERGDTLVNKDPTFGKLIISVAADADAYELLRLACVEVLEETHIEGRQVRPDGSVIDDTEFQTNIQDHIRILKSPLFKQHSQSKAPTRHVNWVVAALRANGKAR